MVNVRVSCGLSAAQAAPSGRGNVPPDVCGHRSTRQPLETPPLIPHVGAFPCRP